jgi:hypothetical protein
MKIEVLYLEGCRNYLPTLERVKTVLLEEGLPAEVSTIAVQDEADAKMPKFLGSPTVRIDGLDIEADTHSLTKSGLACRRYADGLPSAEVIRAALRERKGRGCGVCRFL